MHTYCTNILVRLCIKTDQFRLWAHNKQSVPTSLMTDFTLIWEYLNSFPNITLAHVRFLQPLDQFAQINWPLKAYHRREVWTEELWVAEGWVCEGIRDFWRHAPSPGCGAPPPRPWVTSLCFSFPLYLQYWLRPYEMSTPSPSAWILILCCFNAPHQRGWELGGNRVMVKALPKNVIVQQLKGKCWTTSNSFPPQLFSFPRCY